jgi:hypothetical protein
LSEYPRLEPPRGKRRYGRRLAAIEPWLAEQHRSEDRLLAVIESSPLAIMADGTLFEVMMAAVPVRDATGPLVSHGVA